MTHYQTLGVPESASADQIRTAYRALARELHPDVSPAHASGERFARIASAYEILGDPAKRADYDRRLAADRRVGDPTTAHYSWTNIADAQARGAREVSDFDELYETFFAPREEDGRS